MTLVKDAGIDTWSVCWRVGDHMPVWKALEGLCTVPAQRSKMMEGSVAGHRVGWFQGVGLVFAEGHPKEGGLGGVDELIPAMERVVTELGDRGVNLPTWQERPLDSVGGVAQVIGKTGFAGVRRIDTTVDLSFDDPVDGMRTLNAVAALPLPRIKKGLELQRSRNRVETVYLRGHGGKRVLGRWYDKGVETGTAERGRWIRPEDQRRFSAGGRLTVEAVAQSGFARNAFVRRFEPLWLASKGVKVDGVVGLVKELHRMVEEGTITERQAERVGGYLLLRSAGAELDEGRTVERREKECRDLGLVLDEGLLECGEIDLEALFEQIFDSECWGNQG